MPFFRGVARDEFGNSVNGATVNVFELNTTTLASIFSDAGLATTTANPLTTGADGVYEFFSPSALYDVQISKEGLSTVTLSGVQVGELYADAVVTVAGLVAVNTVTYTQLGGTWAAGNIAANAFSHGGGALTYDGEEKVIAAVNISGTLSTSLNFNAELTIGINGVYNVRPFSSINLLTATPRTIGFTQLVEIENGDVITWGIRADAGAPNVTSVLGLAHTVQVLG